MTVTSSSVGYDQHVECSIGDLYFRAKLLHDLSLQVEIPLPQTYRSSVLNFYLKIWPRKFTWLESKNLPPISLFQ